MDVTEFHLYLLTFLCALACSSTYFCTSLMSSCSFLTSSMWQLASFSVELLNTSHTGAKVLGWQRRRRDTLSSQREREISHLMHHAEGRRRVWTHPSWEKFPADLASLVMDLAYVSSIVLLKRATWVDGDDGDRRWRKLNLKQAKFRYIYIFSP